MDYKVGLSDSARADLASIARFLATTHGHEIALRLGDELLDVSLSLATLPRRGAPVRRRPGLRRLSHRHWLIFYQVNESAGWVEIVRIWDARQDPGALRLP